MKTKEKNPNYTFSNMIYLFIFWSLMGAVLEGFYCLFMSGHWETHVVSMFAPLCIIYGFGAVGFYIAEQYMHKVNFVIKFLVFTAVGTFVELGCGLVLEFAMHVRAWNYSSLPVNFRGHICPEMSVIWGLLGLAFAYLLNPLCDKGLRFMNNKGCRIASYILTAILVIDFTLTFICMYRWHHRHYNIQPANSFEQVIDEKFDDEFMSSRFMEWHFMN